MESRSQVSECESHELRPARYTDRVSSLPGRATTPISLPPPENFDEIKLRGRTSPERAKSRVSFRDTANLFSMALLSIVVFIFVVWYVQAAVSAETAIRTNQVVHQVLRVDLGSTLAVLRVTQGILSTLTTIGVMSALEMLQWILAGRDHGVESSVFLGLSPATGLFGVFRILISRKSRWTARAWSLVR